MADGDEQILVLTEVAARALVGVIERDAVAQPDWGHEGDALAAAVSARQPARREWRVVNVNAESGDSLLGRTRLTREEAENLCRAYVQLRMESRIVTSWEPVGEARDR